MLRISSSYRDSRNGLSTFDFDNGKEKTSLMAYPWIGPAGCIYLWRSRVLYVVRDYVKKGSAQVLLNGITAASRAL